MLTREQILAMPESEYMSPVQLDYFKHLLQERLGETRARIADLQSQLRSVDVEPDITDQASVEEERSRTLNAINRLQESVRKTMAALDLIAEGEYGYCQDTGVPVGLERLLIAPESILCTDAQSVQEHRQRFVRAA
ncbi:TPA: TraR/DksA family transcriptional regulator [Pseudomonas aeruginosa]|nr:TraR/DksA family transcriptional regulator [Pseudomonas aeruginosa]HCH7782493.1 TraR/DksA family transcriptional regulator [Pseudomonas aeruginosa]